MNKVKLDKLVSVIIPVYNLEKYIDRCLYSVINQSYENLEIILIDDGSKDQTGKICDDFAETDCRFKVIHGGNKGVSSARNRGVEQASGKYIIFVDGDDYVSSDYIETLVNCIEINASGMGCADYYLWKDNNISTVSPNNGEITEMSAQNAINLLGEKNSFQGYLWNKIFIKDVIIQNRISFDQTIKIWEDMLFCLKYLININTVSYIRKPVYYYVHRGDSAINCNNIWKENTQLLALEQMWDIIQPYKGKFSTYIRDYYSNYLVGMLGKNMSGNVDVPLIREQVKTIESINGTLTIKHKVKKELIKFMPYLIKVYYR